MKELKLSSAQINLLITILEPVIEDWDWSEIELKQLQSLLLKAKNS